MQLGLNAFLLRRDVSPRLSINDIRKNIPRVFLWDGATASEIPIRELDLVDAAVDGDVFIMTFRRPGASPAWKTFLARSIEYTVGRAADTEGAIIFCAVADQDGLSNSIRWIAWTFGNGSRILARQSSDPRFGLLVALNLIVPIDPNDAHAAEPQVPSQRNRSPQFSDLRYRTTALYFQKAGHRASRGIPIEGFRVDKSTDLVAAVGGATERSILSTSVLGGRSLRFRTDIESINTLYEFSHATLSTSHSDEYRQTLSWIDNIRLIDDVSRIVQLKEELVQLLRDDPVSSNVDAILPDDLIEIDDTRVIKYILYPRERKSNAATQNMSIDRIAVHVRQAAETVEAVQMLEQSLRFISDSDEEVGQATILECICADFISPSDGDQYVVYDGDFYKVDAKFLAQIDAQIAQIPGSSIAFPAYRAETEPDYLARIDNEASDRFVVLDRCLIRLEGESGIEASDLVHHDGAMIHVKRKGKSSTLSHLFLQAANSCEVLRRSGEARAKLANFVRERAHATKLAEAINATHATSLPHRGEIEVAIAFLGNWRERSVYALPLFSRISLIHEARRMEALGYRPTIALISCF